MISAKPYKWYPLLVFSVGIKISVENYFLKTKGSKQVSNNLLTTIYQKKKIKLLMYFPNTNLESFRDINWLTLWDLGISNH